jgi:hypothetical protein
MQDQFRSLINSDRPLKLFEANDTTPWLPVTLVSHSRVQYLANLEKCWAEKLSDQRKLIEELGTPFGCMYRRESFKDQDDMSQKTHENGQARKIVLDQENENSIPGVIELHNGIPEVMHRGRVVEWIRAKLNSEAKTWNWQGQSWLDYKLHTLPCVCKECAESARNVYSDQLNYVWTLKYKGEDKVWLWLLGVKIVCVHSEWFKCSCPDAGTVIIDTATFLEAGGIASLTELKNAWRYLRILSVIETDDTLGNDSTLPLFFHGYANLQVKEGLLINTSCELRSGKDVDWHIGRVHSLSRAGAYVILAGAVREWISVWYSSSRYYTSACIALSILIGGNWFTSCKVIKRHCSKQVGQCLSIREPDQNWRTIVISSGAIALVAPAVLPPIGLLILSMAASVYLCTIVSVISGTGSLTLKGGMLGAMLGAALILVSVPVASVLEIFSGLYYAKHGLEKKRCHTELAQAPWSLRRGEIAVLWLSIGLAAGYDFFFESLPKDLSSVQSKYRGDVMSLERYISGTIVLVCLALIIENISERVNKWAYCALPACTLWADEVVKVGDCKQYYASRKHSSCCHWVDLRVASRHILSPRDCVPAVRRRPTVGLLNPGTDCWIGGELETSNPIVVERQEQTSHMQH